MIISQIMGKTQGRYNEEFPQGSLVRIADEEKLKRFISEWRFHHPLQPENLQYSGHVTRVSRVTFYHGGDELYDLVGIPGIWHEECLSLEEEEGNSRKL